MKQLGKNIQSVQRAVDILNCFHSDHDQLSLTQISSKLQLNKSTVHGIINTLRNNEYMTQSDDGKYILGPALLNKSIHSKSLIQDRLYNAGQCVMGSVSNETNSSACLFFFHYKTPYLLYSISPDNALYRFNGDFNNTPLYSSASGKLALSLLSDSAVESYVAHSPFRSISPFTITDMSALKDNLAKIRELGYSLEQEEVYEGISSISVPVYDNQIMIGSISITNTSRYVERNVDKLVQCLLNACQAIQEKL